MQSYAVGYPFLYNTDTDNNRKQHILIYNSQQDAHVTEFNLSDNCSTCFGRYYHPFSGAQRIVTIAPGNRYTVIDTVKFTDKEYL
jgi:hypothetical protein